MSDRSLCNFCKLEDFKRFAQVSGAELELRPATHRVSLKPLVGGTVRYKDIPGTDVVIGGVWAGWLWSVPDQCVCGGQP